MYAIYNKNFIPETMLAKYPNPARYIDNELVLFCETLEVVTGTPHADIFSIADMASETFTNEDLQDVVTALIVSEPTGKEVQLSKSQGRWLYENDERFMPQEE